MGFLKKRFWLLVGAGGCWWIYFGLCWVVVGGGGYILAGGERWWLIYFGWWRVMVAGDGYVLAGGG